MAYPQQIQTVPKTCTDLLPNMTEYIYFFEQVGDLWAIQTPNKAQKIYDVLSIRKLYQEASRNYINPLDAMIKDQICACYIENKAEPFTSDSKFIRTCLDKNLPALTKKIKKEYLDLKAAIKKDENLMKLTDEQRQKIEALKSRSLANMEKELQPRSAKAKNKTIKTEGAEPKDELDSDVKIITVD